MHEILSKAAAAAPPSAPRQLSFDFLRSPREILGEDGRVRGLRVDVTKLDRSQGGAEPAAVPTGEIEEVRRRKPSDPFSNFASGLFY